MTNKDKAFRAMPLLPDDASADGSPARLAFLAKIERGIRQADAGQTLTHAEVKDRMAKWLA
jgi:predicted transcriptional regulator